jgi:hypothetical protein
LEASGAHFKSLEIPEAHSLCGLRDEEEEVEAVVVARSLRQRCWPEKAMGHERREHFEID